VKVRVGIRRGIVIDNDVYSLDINATTENIGSDEDAFFKGLESRISTYTKPGYQVSGSEMEGDSGLPFLLGKTRVNTDTWEVARDEQLVQFDCARDGFHEDDNLFGKVL